MIDDIMQVRDPSVLLLDEATSALDSESEKVIIFDDFCESCNLCSVSVKTFPHSLSLHNVHDQRPSRRYPLERLREEPRVAQSHHNRPHHHHHLPNHPHLHDQQVVQEALEVAQQGRTSITIAHRLSTIMESDR